VNIVNRNCIFKRGLVYFYVLDFPSIIREHGQENGSLKVISGLGVLTGCVCILSRGGGWRCCKFCIKHGG
jgi:hypothetical protein